MPMFEGDNRRRWRAARKAALEATGGLCLRCGEPATDVHHVTPLQHGGAMFEYENLAPLCQRCHRAQHPVVLRGAMATTRGARMAGTDSDLEVTRYDRPANSYSSAAPKSVNAWRSCRGWNGS